VIARTATAITPEPPGRIGTAISPEDALHYLEALGAWRDQRRDELDRLDEAALAAADGDSATRMPATSATMPGTSGTMPGTSGKAGGPRVTGGAGRSAMTGLTGDVLLSMALWKAVADRHDLLMATWDSGRVGQAERERLSTLIWGRLDATLDPRLAQRPDVPSSSGALAVSLPEAMRLSDALAASLRARLSLDPADADLTGRLRQLRAQLERVRDLVGAEPQETRDPCARRLTKLDERLGEMVDKAKRGADVGGLVGPLEADAARTERDLIVGSATRAEAARDMSRARELRAELEARGAAIRDLAARCVATVNPAPRLAVPDVTALGAVPRAAAEVEAYLARLAQVGRALNQAHAAYATALDERDELRGRLEAYAIKATRVSTGATGTATGTGTGDGADDDLGELFRRAQEVLRGEPADMVRARALVAAHQAYLTSRSTPAGTPTGTTRGRP
jgi:hypothetical protein